MLNIENPGHHTHKEFPIITTIKTAKAPFANPFVKGIRNLTSQIQLLQNNAHGLNSPAAVAGTGQFEIKPSFSQANAQLMNATFPNFSQWGIRPALSPADSIKHGLAMTNQV